jgi:molybdopterin-guanine dinucleotide biosynthesis protein A
MVALRPTEATTSGKWWHRGDGGWLGGGYGGAVGYAAVILAGGAATRLGGRDKPAVPVQGQPMLHRVLDAVAAADQRIVVGPRRAGLPRDVLTARERPSGAGPVAATAAGLDLVTADLVALLAADLPYLTPEAIDSLVSAVDSSTDGALFVDGDGHRQLLCGVWHTAALHRVLDDLGDPAGRSMRALFGALHATELIAPAGDGYPPWFDCDTEEDLREAHRG